MLKLHWISCAEAVLGHPHMLTWYTSFMSPLRWFSLDLENWNPQNAGLGTYHLAGVEFKDEPRGSNKIFDLVVLNPGICEKKIPSPIAQVRLEGWILCIKWILQYLTIYKNQTLQQARTKIYIKTKPNNLFWEALDSSGVYNQNPHTNVQVYIPEN